MHFFFISLKHCLSEMPFSVTCCVLCYIHQGSWAFGYLCNSYIKTVIKWVLGKFNAYQLTFSCKLSHSTLPNLISVSLLQAD